MPPNLLQPKPVFSSASTSFLFLSFSFLLLPSIHLLLLLVHYLFLFLSCLASPNPPILCCDKVGEGEVRSILLHASSMSDISYSLSTLRCRDKLLLARKMFFVRSYGPTRVLFSAANAQGRSILSLWSSPPRNSVAKTQSRGGIVPLACV